MYLLPFSFKINNIRILSYINDIIISFASIVVYKSGNSITSHDTKKLKEIRLNVREKNIVKKMKKNPT
jgi:hypothetical protein